MNFKCFFFMWEINDKFVEPFALQTFNEGLNTAKTFSEKTFSAQTRNVLLGII